MSRFIYLLLFALATADEPQPERILDVRQVIKDALDVMRSYPAPPQFTQVPRYSAPANYYAQQQQRYYPRAYSSPTYNGGVVSQVDQKYGGQVVESQPDYATQLSRWFAYPTNQDMQRLFHLPADVNNLNNRLIRMTFRLCTN